MESKREPDELQRRYLEEINRYPLLSAGEEVELARLARAGDLEARKKLIVANLKLVITIARSFSTYGVPFLDLVEEGNLGLIKAVSKFDPEKGFRFSTYASWWIRQSILRGIATQARTVRIPVHVIQRINHYISTERALSHELMRRPTLEEVAERMKLPASKAVDAYTCSTSAGA